jgi:hypothetical protein
MYINISYINMCRLNKNREWRKEWERVVSGDDVCDCSFDELLDNKKRLVVVVPITKTPIISSSIVPIIQIIYIVSKSQLAT